MMLSMTLRRDAKSYPDKQLAEDDSKTMTVLGYQPQNLIKWGKPFRTVTGKTVWVLKTKTFPGPNVQKAIGDELCQFFLPADMPLSALFSLLKHTHMQLIVEDIATQCASLFIRSNQHSGVVLGGCVTGGHTKYLGLLPEQHYA